MFRLFLRHPQAVQDRMKKKVQLICNNRTSGAVGWGTALQAVSSWVRFPMLSLEFFVDIIPASDRNEYQEYFLGVKAVGAYGWQTYSLHVPIVLKSGNISLLEPSGLVQACNGIALPLLCSNRASGAVAWGTAPQDRRFWVWFPAGSLEIFKWPLPTVRIRLHWKPLHRSEYQEIFLGVKVRPEHRADNYAVQVVPNVKVRMEARHFPLPPWVFMSRYGRLPFKEVP